MTSKQEMIEFLQGIICDEEDLPTCKDILATIEKLPHYADTGETFVPGVDPCWVWYCGSAIPTEPQFFDPGWICDAVVCRDFFPTRHAAEQAAKGGGE